MNNVNGIFLTLNGTSTVACSDNTFTGQTSISSIPLEISANSNTFTAHIENNIFNNNTTGSIRFDLNNVVNANISLLNNTMTNNGTGSQASLGSSFVIISNGTTNQLLDCIEATTCSPETHRMPFTCIHRAHLQLLKPQHLKTRCLILEAPLLSLRLQSILYTACNR